MLQYIMQMLLISYATAVNFESLCLFVLLCSSLVTGMGRMRLFGHVECKDDIDWINCTAVTHG